MSSVKKLVPNLFDKSRYVVHSRTLKLYLKLGMKLTHIHSIVEFNQEPWLAGYVLFCTRKRAEAESDFDKALYKSMINQVFGK